MMNISELPVIELKPLRLVEFSKLSFGEIFSVLNRNTEEGCLYLNGSFETGNAVAITGYAAGAYIFVGDSELVIMYEAK